MEHSEQCPFLTSLIKNSRQLAHPSKIQSLKKQQKRIRSTVQQNPSKQPQSIINSSKRSKIKIKKSPQNKLQFDQNYQDIIQSKYYSTRTRYINDNDQYLEKIKNQIQSELYHRKCLKLLTQQTHSKKKNNYLIAKTAYSILNNKKSKDVHDKLQKEEKKKIKMNYALSSAYAHISNKQLAKGIKKKQECNNQKNDKLQNSTQGNSSLKLYESKLHKKSFSQSDGFFSDSILQKQSMSSLLKEKSRKFKEKQQLVGFAKNAQKYFEVLKRKNKIDENVLNKVFSKIVKKNMMIAEFQKKKNSMADHISISGDSESKHKKIKKENEINRKKRQKFELQLQLQIATIQQQKSIKKNEILQKKSQDIKEKRAKLIQKLLQKKQQLDKQNELRISQKTSRQAQTRIKKAQQKQIKNISIQHLIKKRRQQLQKKQFFSQQVMNLKKSTNQQLQQKLSNIHQQQKNKKLAIAI